MEDSSEFKIGMATIIAIITLLFAGIVYDSMVKHTCIQYMVDAKYAATDIVLVCRGTK